MRYWFFPVWSGDFRLESTDDPNLCLLTVEDPTAKDRKIIEPLLVQARHEGWIPVEAGIQAKGKTEIEIRVPMAKIGPMVAAQIHGDVSTWTALRYTDGKVEVHDGPQILSCGDDGVDADNVPSEKQLPAVVEPAVIEPVAAATVARPKRGCPAPTPAVRRASEVLRAFSTRSQWDQFVREGRMRVIGSHTGKSYLLYHRDQAANQGLSHSLVERGTNRAICCWDDRVPPEEEVLGIKIAVEHHERWLIGLGTGPAFAQLRRRGGLARR